MSIFSFFGKKDQEQASPRRRPDGKGSASSAKREEGSVANRLPPSRDEEAARATALKIDAIESEMASEFTQTKSSEMSPALARDLPPLDFASQKAKDAASLPSQWLIESGSTIQVAHSGVATAIEEAAIMFANNQPALAEDILRAAITADDLQTDIATQAWWMLFDFYRVMGKQQAFEELSIAYLNKFETSPPSWSMVSQASFPATTGAIPVITFIGKLDVGSQRLTARMQSLAESCHVLRLEFLDVTEVDPAGCALLLQALKKLHKTGCEVALVGADELAAKIAGIIEKGRRDDTAPAWLLRMELLRFLNREADFEEVCIDYCITFEVSPPPFTVPDDKAIASANAVYGEDEKVVRMPAIVEGNIEPLVAAWAACFDQTDIVTVDCSSLIRVDFQAAGQLLSSLAPLCKPGKILEFRHVNRLVLVLFQVMGLSELVRVFPTKY